MKKILCDTSVIIDFLRRKDRKESIFYKLLHETLYISIVTHTELYAGKKVWEKTYAREELEELLSGLTILSLNSDISQKAGQLKASNHNTSIMDCIIAATAIVHDMPLVTLNIKDFENLPEIILYRN